MKNYIKILVGLTVTILSVPSTVQGIDSAEMIRAGLESHDRALHIKEGWIRDPYIIIGPDGMYYLTGTTPMPEESSGEEDPFNTGLQGGSIVGWKVQIWRSPDLIDWEYVGAPFSLEDSLHFINENPELMELERSEWRLWAPEIHWLGDRWALVHCPAWVASFVTTEGETIEGPWTHPMQGNLGRRHDPSMFQDDDGIWYLLWNNTLIAPLKRDFSDYAGEAVRIDPAASRIGPDGEEISRIGHEGATMRKIGDKYVHFGTAWSTDQMRKGSYNLYYCTANSITGPYGERTFAGRFLGHGTPFQDKSGKWWCTAFYNANVPPLERKGIQSRDLSDDAQTINPQGVTLVPLEVKVLEDGDIFIRAKDPDYRNPGPDEVQQFPVY